MKRKSLLAVVAVLALLILSASVALAGGIDDPPGVPLYVIIQVDWDGVSDYGDWTVWGPAWDPQVGGTLLTACTECLEMNYEFTFRGKTVHFDEIYVPTVEATPQVHHVVLHDVDGDGMYTGSLSAAHYFSWRAEPDGSWAVLYFDRIDYTIAFDGDGNVTAFHYLQYEHKKLK
jgi:hypothetical protein